MDQTAAKDSWRKCSSCKKDILFGQKHYVCSVSTCNGQRTGYVFCSVSCFERHLPGARHKDAAAIEAQAPARASQRIIPGANASPVSHSSEVLIIASRLKDFIAARSGMNTSASVMDTLSDHVRIICERAIDNARADGRKTLMDRDFSFLKKS